MAKSHVYCRDDHTLLRPGERDENVAVFLAIPFLEAPSEWKVLKSHKNYRMKFQAFAFMDTHDGNRSNPYKVI